ncbi:hypothetical protein KR026_004555 [Drosophila bipectinata]|nr:hypothetical protein KR026_004555 [Drosophila bipectinata]
MGKDPSVVVLATSLAFCAFCPFCARCDETELDIKKGIESLSKVLVKYQAEFDNKVKFAHLHEAIDEINTAMLGYKGKAKVKLPLIRSMNSEARLTYQNCVGPVFEWCISVNGTFNIFIDKIGDSDLSETNRNIIWNMTASILELGLEYTGKSLELLTSVQNRTAQLENAFQEMLHDVHDDFGPGGFYGEEKAALQRRVDNQLAGESNRTKFVGGLYRAIGGLVFGPNGAYMGLPAAYEAFGITSEVQWNQKITYEEQIELIKHLFKDLTQKIKKATDVVKDMESNLEEDKTNLYKLRGHISGANNEKGILLSDMAVLRKTFIPGIKNLQDSCAKYVKWHGFDSPFYQKNSSSSLL